MEELLVQIGNVGFPIVLSMYLLVRLEGKMEELTKSIGKLTDVLEKKWKKRKSLYDEAIAIAVQLIVEYYESIDKELTLSEKYQITFGGQREKGASYAV